MKHILLLILLFGSQFFSIGQVFDEALILDDNSESELETKINEYRKKTRVEIAVLIPQTLYGSDIFDFSMSAFNNDLKLGQKHLNNGILLTIAPTERKIQITVGSGIEYLISDSTAGEIIKSLTPDLRNSQYFIAIDKAIQSFINLTKDYEWSISYNSIDEIYLDSLSSLNKIATFEAKGIREYLTLAPQINFNSIDTIIDTEQINKEVRQFRFMRLKTKDNKIHLLEYTKHNENLNYQLTKEDTWRKVYVRIKNTVPLSFQLLDVE